MLKLASRTTIFAGLCGWLAIAPAPVAAADFVMVRSSKNSVAELGVHDLRDFLQGKKSSWPNGLKVDLVLNAEGTPELKWLAQEVLGVPETVLMSRIKQNVFRGEMKKPGFVATGQDCLAEVKRQQGAFCVVDAATANALPEGVAVLKISR